MFFLSDGLLVAAEHSAAALGAQCPPWFTVKRGLGEVSFVRPNLWSRPPPRAAVSFL